MPNSGMLDHRAYSARGRRSHTHWMDPWPTDTGYHTMKFSKHLYSQTVRLQSNKTTFNPSNSRPSSAIHTNNSINPFHTKVKATCGHFFSNGTDNKKRRIGIPPSNLIAWRAIYSNRAGGKIETAR